MRWVVIQTFVVTIATAIANPAFAQSVLSITKADTPDPVNAGNLLTYSMSATNQGPDPALNMIVSDPLPAGTVFISAVASAGATLTTPAVGANGTVTAVWDAAGGTPGGLTAAAGTRSLTIVVRVCPEFGCNSPLSNTATVSATGATSQDATSATVVNIVGDLSITKSGPTEALRGSAVTYVLTLQNSGPSNMAGAVVTDTLPPGVVATSVNTTFAGGVCSILPGSGQVSCTISFGAANQCTTTEPTSGTITIEADVLPSAVSGDNVATIAPGTCGTDPDLTDNTATLPLLVSAAIAPAMHGAGLAALVALLAGAGALRVRRRTH